MDTLEGANPRHDRPDRIQARSRQSVLNHIAKIPESIADSETVRKSEDEPVNGKVSLTKIAQIIEFKKVPAVVTETGGGLSTLFVGNPFANGDYPLAAGPGVFDERGEALIGFEDFCFGREVNGEIEKPSFITEGDEEQIVEKLLAHIAVANARRASMKGYNDVLNTATTIDECSSEALETGLTRSWCSCPLDSVGAPIRCEQTDVECRKHTDPGYAVPADTAVRMMLRARNEASAAL
jgi:hypothetical protein